MVRVSLNLLITLGFYVDIKLNLFAIVVTYTSTGILKANLEQWDVDFVYVMGEFMVILLCALLFTIVTVLFGKHAIQNRKLRVQMTEYLNLMNRMHEGIIVLKNFF